MFFCVDSLALNFQQQMSFLLVAQEAILSGEWWIVLLISFHIFTTIFIIASRHSLMVELPIFVILSKQWFYFFIMSLRRVFFNSSASMALAAERVNEWGAKNWKKFANDQWFDSHGLFISVVYTLPILLNCLMVVILWLKSLSNLVIVFGQHKVREKKRLELEKKE